MEKNKQILINMIAQIISFIVNVGISFFLTAFIVKNIGKEIFGFWGLANNFVSYIGVLTIALNSTVNRFVTISLHKKDYTSANKYFSSVALANITLSAILIIPILLLVTFLDNMLVIPKEFVIDIKLLWLFIFINFLVNLGSGVLEVSTFAKNRLDMVATTTIISNTTRALLLIILFNLLSPHLWYVGLALLICTFYTASARYRFFKRLTPKLMIKRKYFDWKFMKEMLLIGFWNSFNQLSIILITGLNLLITNLLIGAKDMSLLSVAVTIPTQIQSFVQIVANTFSPKLTATYAKGDLSVLAKEVIFSMKVTGYLGSIPIIGLMIFGGDFFPLWLNTVSSADITKIQLLSILTLIPLIGNTFINPLFNINTVLAKVKIPVLTNFLIGILNIVIVYVLIRYFNLGVYTVAGVSAILVLGRMLLFVPIYSAHILKLSWLTFYKFLLKGFLSLTIVIFVLLSIKFVTDINSWGSLAIVCSIAGIVGYFINFLLIFNREEKRTVINVLKRKFKNKNLTRRAE